MNHLWCFTSDDVILQYNKLLQSSSRKYKTWINETVATHIISSSYRQLNKYLLLCSRPASRVLFSWSSHWSRLAARWSGSRCSSSPPLLCAPPSAFTWLASPWRQTCCSMATGTVCRPVHRETFHLPVSESELSLCCCCWGMILTENQTLS